MTAGINLGDLERLFRRKQISRWQFVQGLAAIGLSASGIELLTGTDALSDSITGSQTAAKYLVIMTLDAFRPDYLQLAPMPALRALQRAGTTYDRAWVGQLESETPVSHATISTGSLPKHDGVIGFEWRDPTTKEEVLDGWPPGVLAGKLEQDMKAARVASISSIVKGAFPQETIVALSSEKSYAASAMGTWAADYILFHQRGPNGLLTPSALPGHAPDSIFFQHPELQTTLPMKHFTDWDYLSGMLALAAIDQYLPKVLMVNFPGADVYGHEYGGPANPGVFRQIAAGIDRNIGRIVDAYKAAGIFDQTVFIVVSDHGMVPNDRAVAGSVTKATVRASGGSYQFHTGGTAADIYLHNYWHARAVSAGMLKVPNVAASYYKANQHGQYEYLPAPGQRLNPALDAAYRHLLDTFTGATAPDVVVPFRENTVGTNSTSAHGDHGGMNWGAQHIPLIFSGPGVRRGALSNFPARLIDIAPTALRLLGLPGPGMDGVVLADAVSSAPASDVAVQSALGGQLTAYQNALIQQSLDNIAEDKKLGFVPPPPMPARP